MKLRKSVYMKRSEGELFLSREVYAISNEQKAQYVLVGTYSEANIVVYVNVSIVRLSDSRVVASYDYEVPLGANNRKLLQE
jgi:TolB-like protein